MDPPRHRWYDAAAGPSSCRVRFKRPYHAPSVKQSGHQARQRGTGDAQQTHANDCLGNGTAQCVGATALSAQDKYTVKVPGGLAFSEFRGYEGWHLVSISQDG